jgi:hypothetical protein
MRANVFRVFGKQRTGALIASSPRRPWLRRPPPSLPTPLATHRPYYRHFSSTHVLSDEPSFQTTFEDPSRKGLFYHLVHPPTPLSNTHPVFAVSLLPDPPPLSESSTVLGWLPAETPGDDREAGLNDFLENRTCGSFNFGHHPSKFVLIFSFHFFFAARFLPLLHDAISEGLAEGVDDIQAAGAQQLGEGWMHIHGKRHERASFPNCGNNTVPPSRLALTSLYLTSRCDNRRSQYPTSESRRRSG